MNAPFKRGFKMESFKELALAEYNSDIKTVRRAGINGKPFSFSCLYRRFAC